MFALESPSPGVEGVSPDLRSRAGRKPILRARVSGREASEERSRLLELPAWRVRLLNPPRLALHELNNLVTRSAGSAAICDRAGPPGTARLAELSWPAAGARHGRRAFTTDTRGGLSQWYGGRLGRLDSWHGPRTAAAAEDQTVVIAPGSKPWTIVACSRPPRAPPPCNILWFPIVLLPFMPGPHRRPCLINMARPVFQVQGSAPCNWLSRLLNPSALPEQ